MKLLKPSIHIFKGFIFHAFLLFAYDAQGIIVDCAVLKCPESEKTVYLFTDFHIAQKEVAENQAKSLVSFIERHPNRKILVDSLGTGMPSTEYIYQNLSEQPDDVVISDIIRGDYQEQLLGQVAQLALAKGYEVEEDIRKFVEQRQLQLDTFQIRFQQYVNNLVQYPVFKERFDRCAAGEGANFEPESKELVTIDDLVCKYFDFYDYQLLDTILHASEKNIIIICGGMHTLRMIKYLTEHFEYVKIKAESFVAKDTEEFTKNVNFALSMINIPVLKSDLSKYQNAKKVLQTLLWEKFQAIYKIVPVEDFVALD